jgi:hypothetical protein
VRYRSNAVSAQRHHRRSPHVARER